MSGEFDFKNDTFTFEGTNGWSWRIHFVSLCTRAIELSTKNHAKTWWNLLFDDHDKEGTGHYTLCNFFEMVEHLSEAPAALKGASDWQTDPILLRKVAADYPALAKSWLTN